MISFFPEIVSFFKNPSFSQNELEELINLTNSKYVEKDINQKAHSLIKLELLKYKLQGENKDSNESKKIVSESSKKTRIKTNPFEARNIWVNETLTNIQSMTIQEIADVLNVRVQLIIAIMGRRGHTLNKTEVVSSEIFDSLRDYIKNRLEIIYRRQNKEQVDQIRVVKVRKRSSLSDKGVYSKLQLHGLGKLIYIRSK